MKTFLGILFSLLFWFAPFEGSVNAFGIQEYLRKSALACKGKKEGDFCKFATKTKKRQGYCKIRTKKPSHLPPMYCRSSRKATRMENLRLSSKACRNKKIGDSCEYTTARKSRKRRGYCAKKDKKPSEIRCKIGAKAGAKAKAKAAKAKVKAAKVKVKAAKVKAKAAKAEAKAAKAKVKSLAKPAQK